MRYIDKNEIYRLTDGGLDIFKHYFPSYKYGNSKAFLKLRPGERTASARIAFYNGTWRVTDFGQSSDINSMKAIPFVMYIENLVYIDALRFIEEVIIKRTVGSGGFKKPMYQAQYSFREVTPEDSKGEYNFVYKSEASKTDLEAIGRYVDNALLKKFYCKPVEFYEYCSFSKKLKRDVVHIFTATEDYPMFVFDYGRFIYIGKKPTNYIYGLKQIEKSDNEFVDEETGDIAVPEYKPDALVRDVFRCSGESDALNVASLGHHVYWLNSESANFDFGQMP